MWFIYIHKTMKKYNDNHKILSDKAELMYNINRIFFDI